MKGITKRVLALLLACALTGFLGIGYTAHADDNKGSTSSTIDEDLKNGEAWTGGNSYNSTVIKDATKKLVNELESKLNSSKIKISGADMSISTLSGSAKDDLHDNGVTPCVKEFVKASAKEVCGGGSDSKANAGCLKGIYYFDLYGNPGDVTLKLEDDVDASDSYAIVLHYTGNYGDEDGITAQYVKINSSGKLTAHFNTLSPVAIIATDCGSAQKLVNTWSHDGGSDNGNYAANSYTSYNATVPILQPGTVAANTGYTPTATTTATQAVAANTSAVAPVAKTTNVATTATPATTITNQNGQSINVTPLKSETKTTEQKEFKDGYIVITTTTVTTTTYANPTY